MKILFISHYSAKGGANNELLWLSQELIKKGHEVLILLPTAGAFLEDLDLHQIAYKILPYKRWICRVDVKRTHLMKLVALRNRLINWCVAWKIKNIAIKEKIEVIHTNDSLNVVGCYAATLAKLPHVWHLREFLEEDYGLSIMYSEAYVKKWFSRSDRVVAISRAIKEKYNKLMITNNFIQIYDGVPIVCYPEENEHQVGQKLRVLYAGGTNTGKGYEEVLNIIGCLKNKYGINLQLLVAGNCEQRQDYEDAIIQLGLSDSIKYLGFTNKLDEIRRESDIFLVTSKKEAFGLVTVEAMLSGCIVVGRASGGTAEIIDDGVNGFLYSPENIDEACQKIMCIVNGEINISDIRTKAQKHAYDNYNISRTCDEILHVYLDIIKEH